MRVKKRVKKTHIFPKQPFIIIVDQDKKEGKKIEKMLYPNYIKTMVAIHSKLNNLITVSLSYPAYQFDLILLEILHPDDSRGGIPMIDSLKRNPATSRIQIAAMVDPKSTPEYREWLISIGCCGYIAKPVERWELLSVVRDCVLEAEDMELESDFF